VSSGHTLGPWQAEVDDQTGIGRTHSVYICTSEGWPEGQLARVNTMDGFGEREANARLIASAPDLLEALTWAVDHFDGNTRCNAEQETNCIEKCRAAILKATGAA